MFEGRARAGGFEGEVEGGAFQRFQIDDVLEMDGFADTGLAGIALDILDNPPEIGIEIVGDRYNIRSRFPDNDTPDKPHPLPDRPKPAILPRIEANNRRENRPNKTASDNT